MGNRIVTLSFLSAITVSFLLGAAPALAVTETLVDDLQVYTIEPNYFGGAWVQFKDDSGTLVRECSKNKWGGFYLYEGGSAAVSAAEMERLYSALLGAKLSGNPVRLRFVDEDPYCQIVLIRLN